MRITSGSLSSRAIKQPQNIRPTQDKIRKALFDTIRNKVMDSYFLELFAGSGAVGIEALSNGAKEVILVEKDNQCCRIIKDNLSKLGLLDKSQKSLNNIFVLSMDALKSLDIFCRNNKKFDIMFLDPPYYKDLAKKTLQKITTCDILTPSGLVIVEHSKKDILENKYNNLTCFKQKRYGDTVLSFYNKE